MELLNTQFDEQFEKLKPLGLKFLPWVGADYEKSETKILIVGDSNYVEGEDDKEIEKKINNLSENYTREQISKILLREDTNKLYRFFYKKVPMVVLGIKESKSNKLRQGFIVNVFFWKQVAFYNFVQRPMKKIGNLIENPKEKDFTEAVPLFEEVLKILKPHYVSFMSKIASEHLGADEEPIVKQINGNEVIIFYLDDPSRLNEKKLFKIKEDFKRLKENAENFYNTIEKNWQESFLFIPSKITKIGNYIFKRGEKYKSPPSISFSINYDGQKQETNENYKDLENYSFTIEYSVGEGDFEDDEDFYYGLCLVNDDNANNYRVKFKNNEVLFRDKWYGPNDSWLCWKYIKPETLVYLYENDSFKQKKAIEDMMQDVANLLEELEIR